MGQVVVSSFILRCGLGAGGRYHVIAFVCLLLVFFFFFSYVFVFCCLTFSVRFS